MNTFFIAKAFICISQAISKLLVPERNTWTRHNSKKNFSYVYSEQGRIKFYCKLK